MHRSLLLAFLFTPLVFAEAQDSTAIDRDAYLAAERKKADEALASWRVATTSSEKEALAGIAIDAAVHAEYPEAVLEIASDRIYPGRKIEIPTAVRPVELEVLTTLEQAKPNRYGGTFPWVIRRISTETFEAWQPGHGLLFNRKGAVLNEAHPPRRDGVGREWYGAFLPDGRWITTDLWELDRTLSLFSAAGKYRREIPASVLVPKGADDWGTDLIGWARSDKDGQGWIVSVGSEAGRGLAYVRPDGTHRILANKENPFAMCFPRDLEPKGFYISLFTSSDDLQLLFDREEPGHGAFVGYPTYSLPPASGSILLADGDSHFGFLPASHSVFIEREIYGENSSKTYETWFYDERPKFTGWIAARPVGDSSTKDSMLFLTDRGNVVTLNRSLKVASQVRFTFPNGHSAVPEKTFADLHLGFFRDGDRLTLARWKPKL